MKLMPAILGAFLCLILAAIAFAFLATCARLGPDAGTVGGGPDDRVSQAMEE